jgi:hypothetical protein
LDNPVKVIASPGSLITEVQPLQAYGTSQIPEASSGTETISGMAAIVFVVTGRGMSSRSVRGIGITTGTAIAIIGGTAIGAASLMDRG